jgi:hypothetical protein
MVVSMSSGSNWLSSRTVGPATYSRRLPCRACPSVVRSRLASPRISPTMAQAVDQLERMGYVERRPNPRDRRSRLVFLTERGASVKPVTHATAARVEER